MFAEEVRSFAKRLKGFFRSLSLRTQLLLILLFLLLTSIGSLTIIYTKSEEKILEKVTDNIDDITKAIQISVEELTYRGDSTQRLKTYVDTLNKKGIREISILSDASEVIASSDPRKIGTVQQPPKKITIDKTGRKKDLMITARLGEETGKKEGQRLYSVIMPVSIKGQRMGYVHVSMVLDDYKYLQQRNHLKRILSTIFAFSIGTIICLIFAEKYTDPIKRIATAAKKIAGGELVKIRDTGRGDEIGVMVKSFNEMVDKLSERKELEEKLKKTEQLSMIGQLASGIAHEVRNPLNFLSLSIGHIKDRVTEENIAGREDITALLDNLKKEIYRVNELINNFLFVGKPIVLNRTWVAPEALVSDALAMVKDKVRDEIELTTICKDGGQLYCDVEYMRICVINLLLNSIQAIEGTGTILVECGNDGGFSYISVTDNGKGVAQEEAGKIFEPYYSTKKYGIGLGLTITKRLVEEHGGTISMESSAGQRTVITIKVPRHEA
ncbi:MAG: HAMP domain-containing sensor histidine kinase [Syntrophorhabdales bacterium]|jgi:signal transduction histidine kinase